MPTIPYGRQSVDEADLAAVSAVLTSDFLTQGPHVEHFEAALVEACGATHAVAVNSATSALHVAYLALGLGPGKRLWSTPNTFVSTTNAALLCGASVDFVDIDPQTYNLDPQALAHKLETARRRGEPGPDVVATVDFAGQPCDVASIRKLADAYGFRVVEDASHAIGASWRGEPIGCGQHADITVFSFHPVKIITTGEGGAAMTNDSVLAESMRLLRTHGVTRQVDRLEGATHGAWYYEQVALGLNYRMTDIQAALGVSQIKRLESFIARRRTIAARYDVELTDLPLKTPWQSEDSVSAYHLYPVTLDLQRLKGGRKAFFDLLRARGIGVQVHYIPVHTHPYYKRLGFQVEDYPCSERYYESCISLPIFPALTDQEQSRVIRTVQEVSFDLGVD
ncbi:UDP-4-amino-4,6-dideoxy-N-acetyl-beta-L-altrosamine transaminase [Methylobacterium sp. PvR107]|uniref:UDP-4-amino-4, 6-dideoxy-N-acetyl-beta-L-altrosamine transaminase n=1 Tax=Methylobacterium sp. PvR107 TaxID=2806597 RepID=UPI001AE1010B|nr:UDP-4-amino-4,6-dideoxy-N-acetyl-beta-L-altrosamine transaminase [Methylobacterium sp. PvR107]MBP1178466.1 UDP-4-amino-4,6-dideoxy-N-acetyl-beta-L-altrosamine transaminase [Methylobacterium sp. PvR107]